MGESQILMRGLKKKIHIHSSARDHILTRFPGLRKASKWPAARRATVKSGMTHTQRGVEMTQNFGKFSINSD